MIDDYHLQNLTTSSFINLSTGPWRAPWISTVQEHAHTARTSLRQSSQHTLICRSIIIGSRRSFDEATQSVRDNGTYRRPSGMTTQFLAIIAE